MSNDNGSPEEIKTEEAEAPVVEKTEEAPKEDEVSIEDLAGPLPETKSDAIPLKKYMSEKNARKEAEAQVKDLQKAILDNANDKALDSDAIRELSQKHDISEEALRDLIKVSSNATRAQVKKEIEDELSPQIQELETAKAERAQRDWNKKFNTAVSNTLTDMPEFTELVDKDDIKDWVQSGKYSKLTLPQLIEQKYGKYVKGKKSMDGDYAPAREHEIPDVHNMTDGDYANLDKDPALKAKWKEGLEDRLRHIM
jgi:hypothetical protein